MLIGGILLGLVAGLALGGRLENLAAVRLRLLPLIFGAVIVRFLTEAALATGSATTETLRTPLLATAYGFLIVGLWANRSLPGMALAFVGILSNAFAIVANMGHMPVWEPSLAGAGLSTADVGPVLHVILKPELDVNFLLHAGPLGDVIPIPFPLIRNVASVGDVFLSVGLAFFLFAIVLRSPDERDADERAADGRDTDDRPSTLRGIAAAARLPRTLDSALGRGTFQPGTGLGAGLSESSVVERPMVLVERSAGGAAVLRTGARVALPGRPSILDRARNHPYVSLALNGSFSALWAGQLISLFGDRIHQIALGVFVYTATNSPLALALAYVAATIPNLFFSPIAGAFVDRWDQKQILVVSDFMRAALVLLIPVVATANLLLVYPLVFVITTISIFFRPARVAVLPRIVRDDDLLAANSAMWLGETLADVVGYLVAAIFTGFLGAALPLAFWFDAATYVASGVLLASIAIPPLARATHDLANRPRVVDDLRAGWRFLRSDHVLLANTMQGVVGQFSIGTLTALTLVYIAQVLSGQVASTVGFAGFEAALGAGNFIGGFALGLVAYKLPRGKLVVAGYVGFGLCVTGLALTGVYPVALGLAAGCGIANMIFVIPSQTLFQERTPADMLGRVVGFRFAAVFGSLTLAMAVGGILGSTLGPQAVLAVAGMLSIGAGLAGLAYGPVRNA